jgi:hypothetical protein
MSWPDAGSHVTRPVWVVAVTSCADADGAVKDVAPPDCCVGVVGV